MNALKRHRNFSDLFPVPDFLLMATSGVAISDGSIKFLELNRGSKGGEFELGQFKQINLPEGAIEGGFIQKKDEVVKALKEISSKNGVKHVRASLPEEKSYLFTTIIDDVSSENLRDAVAFVIEENAPVTLADSIFDFEVLEEKAGKIKVLVTVLSKKVVGAYSEIFELAGLTPIAFDIESQAIAKAIVPQNDSRTHLIVNIEEKKTGLYVVEERRVKFSLTPSIGSLSSDVSDLRGEIRKLFTFWNTRLNSDGVPEGKVEKILLVGPGSANKDFANNLMLGIGVEYSWGNVWANVLTLSKTPPKLTFEESLSYATAMGLALAQRN